MYHNRQKQHLQATLTLLQVQAWPHCTRSPWRSCRPVGGTPRPARVSLQTWAAMQESAWITSQPLTIASFIVSPDEALRRQARRPPSLEGLWCRITHEKLFIASHVDPLSVTAGCAAADSITFVEAFGLLSRELGPTMSILVRACRQVWPSQSEGPKKTSNYSLLASNLEQQTDQSRPPYHGPSSLWGCYVLVPTSSSLEKLLICSLFCKWAFSQQFHHVVLLKNLFLQQPKCHLKRGAAFIEGVVPDI